MYEANIIQHVLDESPSKEGGELEAAEVGLASKS